MRRPSTLLSPLFVFALSSLAACGGKGKNGANTPTSTMGGVTPAGAGDAIGGTNGTGTGSSSAEGSSTSTSSAPAASIDAALPGDVEKTPPFARRAECPEKPGCPWPKAVVPIPESLHAQIDASAPFFLWEQVLPRKTSMALPKHVGVDMYILLIDGEVSILADDIPGKQKRLWKWNAARVPGIGVTVFAKEPTRAIVAFVTNTPGATIGQAGTVGGKVAWTKRPAPVESVELDKQPDLAWGSGAYHVRLGFQGGSASLESLLASKNANIAEHTHDKEWELLAILSGEGTLVRKPNGKEEDTKVAPGTFASIPPGVPHAFVASGTAPLVAVQLYLPPGPEQRFKKLADDAKK